MGGGRGGGGGGGLQQFKGTVRWESAKPVIEALKAQPPDAFANHYVISVSGIPLSPGRRRAAPGDEEGNAPSAAMLDRLKGLTTLQPKGRESAQPGIVQSQRQLGDEVLLFGFSKEILPLGPKDKEILFTTLLGSFHVKAKFNLKDMMYRGNLAV
jgi:hypothetical protein